MEWGMKDGDYTIATDLQPQDFRVPDTDFYWNPLTEQLIGNGSTIIDLAFLKERGRLVTVEHKGDTDFYVYGNLAITWITALGKPLAVYDILRGKFIFIPPKYENQIKDIARRAERSRQARDLRRTLGTRNRHQKKMRRRRMRRGR